MMNLKIHHTLSLQLGLNDKWGREYLSLLFFFRTEQKTKGKSDLKI
jgi:hypothetical protein